MLNQVQHDRVLSLQANNLSLRVREFVIVGWGFVIACWGFVIAGWGFVIAGLTRNLMSHCILDAESSLAWQTHGKTKRWNDSCTSTQRPTARYLAHRLKPVSHL